jgi:hypothetical protein
MVQRLVDREVGKCGGLWPTKRGEKQRPVAMRESVERKGV